MMKDCSVIVVNYNTGELLLQAVEAALINASTKEIIVVDNNSCDNSMDLLSESTGISKYYRKKNYGFAASCNFGAKSAKSETLLFLNPDCVVQKTTIDDLATKLNQNKEAAIIGCNIINPNGSEQRASRRRLPTFWRALKTFTKIEKLARICPCFAGVNLSHQPMPIALKKVEAISGAFIMMKTSVFNQIGGFDEMFPLHFEDLDLFKRTLSVGKDILFDPNHTVVHHQGVSSQSNPEVAKLKKIGRQRYFKKHLSYLSYLLIKAIK